MHISKLFAAACSLVVLSVLALAQPPKYDDIANYLQEEMAKTRTPGAVLAIVQGDKIVYSRALGLANSESKQAVAPDMLFRIGSMTKMYTAATLLTLVEEGKVELNAPVGKYLEGLPPRLSKVTVHQLITHSAGFADRANLMGPRHDDGALIDGVKDLNDSLFFTEPGKVFSYANPGWLLAGYLIEKVSGEPYRVAVEKRILRPLGMMKSTFLPTVAMTYPLSVGHTGDPDKDPVVERPMEDNAREWPEGFLFSNVQELARFASAFMNGGVIDGKKVLSSSLINLMSGKYVPVPSDGPASFYGYGLIVGVNQGVNVVEHGGTMLGYASDFYMIPETKTAIIILGNRRVHFMGTVDKAIQVLFPEKARKTAASAISLTDAEAAEYLGNYAQNGVRVEIIRTSNGIAMRQGNTEYPLSRIEKDAFLGRMPGFPEPLRFSFVRDSNKQIEFFHFRLRAWKKVQ